MQLFDTHTHSCFSADSRMELQAAINQAKARSLAGIVFTEHFDFDVPEGITAFEFDPEQQQQAIRSLCQHEDPQLTVLAGIEVGLQPGSVQKIKNLLEGHHFDQIIASVHFVDGKDPYHGEYYVGLSPKEAYGRYLEVIYECITLMPDFDILGHYDYIARYSPYPDSICYKDYADVLDSILRLLVERGQTLELNTKTYRIKPDGNPLPDPVIYRRFKELGGEALSFGSDAHKIGHIGFHFEEYHQWVKDLGFRYSIHYRDRKPVLLPL